MNVSTFIANALGVILLIVWLLLLPAGKVCVRQVLELLSLKLETENLNEKLEFWLEHADHFQKITVSFIHKEIFRTFAGLSASFECLYQKGMTRCEDDNFHRRMKYAINITIFRWHILPFIVGVGLILSGNVWLLLVLLIGWIFSFMLIPVSKVEFILAITSGWFYGGLIFSYFSSTSNLWYYTIRIMGVVFMFIVWMIINVIFLFPYIRYHSGYDKYKSSHS